MEGLANRRPWVPVELVEFVRLDKDFSEEGWYIASHSGVCEQARVFLGGGTWLAGFDDGGVAFAYRDDDGDHDPIDLLGLFKAALWEMQFPNSAPKFCVKFPDREAPIDLGDAQTERRLEAHIGTMGWLGRWALVAWVVALV